MLHAAIIHHDHHQVHRFDSDLQAPASAADRDEGRSAPPGGGAASRDSTAMLAAKDKSSFDEMRNNDDALSVIENGVWNSMIRRCLDAVQNFCCISQPLHRIFMSR